ncbi:uncharacterized protein LOC134250142 [Saccostrea cucullata]|uniref:uncharacterized protein LOC134250142 n=1 Tax=Saccostrea cuccullata TaxID=36930 RepID=UPI002ED0D141
MPLQSQEFMAGPMMNLHSSHKESNANKVTSVNKNKLTSQPGVSASQSAKKSVSGKVKSNAGNPTTNPTSQSGEVDPETISADEQLDENQMQSKSEKPTKKKKDEKVSKNVDSESEEQTAKPADQAEEVDTQSFYAAEKSIQNQIPLNTAEYPPKTTENKYSFKPLESSWNAETQLTPKRIASKDDLSLQTDATSKASARSATQFASEEASSDRIGPVAKPNAQHSQSNARFKDPESATKSAANPVTVNVASNNVGFNECPKTNLLSIKHDTPSVKDSAEKTLSLSNEKTTETEIKEKQNSSLSYISKLSTNAESKTPGKESRKTNAQSPTQSAEKKVFSKPEFAIKPPVSSANNNVASDGDGSSMRSIEEWPPNKFATSDDKPSVENTPSMSVEKTKEDEQKMGQNKSSNYLSDQSTNVGTLLLEKTGNPLVAIAIAVGVEIVFVSFELYNIHKIKIDDSMTRRQRRRAMFSSVIAVGAGLFAWFVGGLYIPNSFGGKCLVYVAFRFGGKFLGKQFFEKLFPF